MQETYWGHVLYRIAERAIVLVASQPKTVPHGIFDFGENGTGESGSPQAVCFRGSELGADASEFSLHFRISGHRGQAGFPLVLDKCQFSLSKVPLTATLAVGGFPSFRMRPDIVLNLQNRFLNFKILRRAKYTI